MSYRPRRAPQSETLALRGLQFQLYRWPGADPRPVVLVHGWGDTSETWQFVIDQLSPARTWVAMDMRGFGRTQRRPAHVPRAEAAIDRTWPVEPAPTTATQGHRHTAARALLGNRRDLRRAIVVMTVLGPCRSLEASERR